MNPGIRLVIIDDRPLFARGLELLLPAVSEGRATVVGTTTDAASAASLALRERPDIALVDLHMPAPGGVRAIAAVRRAAPRVRVLAMSGDDDPATAIGALSAGAEGFLPKSSEPADLLPPLLVALEGWSVLPAGLLAAVVARATGPRPATVDLAPSERGLLQLISAGSSTTEIATELHISERTVKRQTAALLRKLRVSSRTEAAALAGSTGLL